MSAWEKTVKRLQRLERKLGIHLPRWVSSRQSPRSSARGAVEEKLEDSCAVGLTSHDTLSPRHVETKLPISVQSCDSAKKVHFPSPDDEAKFGEKALIQGVEIEQNNCTRFYRAFKRLRKKNPELARVRYQQAVDAADRLKKIRDEQFRNFVKRIGFRSRDWSSVSFSKSETANTVERYFGSLDKEPTYLFSYPGLEPEEGSIDDETLAGRVFSLYMTRKCLGSNTILEVEKNHAEFFKRISNPAPPHERRGDFLAYLQVLARSVFEVDHPADPSYPSLMPNHDGACIEKSKAAGGKRILQAYINEQVEVGADDGMPFPPPLFNEPKIYNTDRSVPQGANPVIAQTIVTGGKCRTITIDSFANDRYSYLNKYMAEKIAAYPWSVFKKKNLETFCQEFDTTGDAWYLSGDLEAATDNFATECFETVLPIAVAQFYPDETREDHCRRIFGYTTRAQFVRSRQDFTVIAQQKRGQLMGSNLSFPVLCLISFAIATFEDLSCQLSDDLEENRDILMNYNRVGINGDDQILRWQRGNAESWVSNVKAAGGVASRGKTLFNPEYWSVNSYLFRKGKKIPFLHLSTLIAEKSLAKWYLSENSYKEVLAVPWADRSIREIYEVAENCKVHIPRKYGGIGLEIRYDLLQSYLEAKVTSQLSERKTLIGQSIPIPTIVVTGPDEEFTEAVNTPFAPRKEVGELYRRSGLHVTSKLTPFEQLVRDFVVSFGVDKSFAERLAQEKVDKGVRKYLLDTEHSELLDTYREEMMNDLLGVKSGYIITRPSLQPLPPTPFQSLEFETFSYF